LEFCRDLYDSIFVPGDAIGVVSSAVDQGSRV
jgi:hypothetical protein